MPGGNFSASKNKLAIDRATGKIDLKKTIENEFFNDDPENDGVAYQLRYTDDEYYDYITERQMKARRGRRDIPPEKNREIVIDALAKFIVKDWKGLEIEGADGKLEPFEYSVENAKKLLDMSDYVRNLVTREASALENFSEIKEKESPAGDLKSGSDVVA